MGAGGGGGGERKYLQDCLSLVTLTDRHTQGSTWSKVRLEAAVPTQVTRSSFIPKSKMGCGQ